LPALLGLWDLSRTAPAPLLTIPLPHAAHDAGSIPISAAPVFLSDNRRALIGYQDGTLRLYDLSSGQAVLTIAAHDHPVRSVGISADGSLAITGSDDGSMKLWDIAAGKLKLEFRDTAKPLKNWVTHVAISPDRRQVLSISGVSPATMLSSNYDDTLTLWDAQTGRQVLATDNSSATARRSPRPPSPPTAGPFSPAAKTAPPGCGKPVPATSSQPCADTRPPSTRRPFPMTCTGPSPAPAIPKTPAATSLWNFKLAGPN
jgi:WD40 repeat protein